MFLHLGADTVVAIKDVISISDYRSFRSASNREFIKKMRSDQRVIDISGNTPKSFVMAEDKIYLSAISSLTLKKRADNLIYNEE